MQLEFQCVKCEESFHLEVADLTTDPSMLRCPGCGARASDESVELVIGALEELFAALAPLRRKFTTSVEVDSEDLPPPYDEVPIAAKSPALLDEEDEEEDLDEEEELERDADEI